MPISDTQELLFNLDVGTLQARVQELQVCVGEGGEEVETVCEVSLLDSFILHLSSSLTRSLSRFRDLTRWRSLCLSLSVSLSRCLSLDGVLFDTTLPPPFFLSSHFSALLPTFALSHPGEADE